MEFSDLARLASGHIEARIIQVAVELGLFDALEGKNLDASAISASIRTDLRATQLLLNALSSLSLLEEKNDLFSLTQISSNYLLRSSPKYFGGMILFESSLWDCWKKLDEAIRTGKTVRPPDMYQQNRAETERFIEAMQSLVQARGDAEILTGRLDLSGIKNLLDVGSGPGTYPIHFCRNYPGLTATIFDLPGTMKVTEKIVKASGLGDRIRLLTGDYRTDPIPGKYEIAFLSNIIHAESSEENRRLMAKLFSRLDPGGKIIIKDHILDDTLTQPTAGAVFALLMLLTTDRGRCYSFSEVKAWLESAGFKRISEIHLPFPLTSSLVIGEKH